MMEKHQNESLRADHRTKVIGRHRILPHGARSSLLKNNGKSIFTLGERGIGEKVAKPSDIEN